MIDRKIFHLLHGVVVFNIHAVFFFNGNVVSELKPVLKWANVSSRT